MSKPDIYGILTNIKKVIDNNIEGDIVELGCNIGTTSIFIKKFLDIYAPEKKFYVYDSWQGLPERHEKDGNNTTTFIKGSCQTNKENFINVFKHFNLELPIINSGFFNDISDEKYPEKICFAFYDGDLYTSIMDSFNKTFHKILKGGIIIIDDVGGRPLDEHELPGAELAIIDFLKDKNLSYTYDGYANKNYIFGEALGGAKIIKEY
jgi:O-methyltransferase